MVRAKGVVEDDINYQELIEGREFYYTGYGYTGCGENYSPVSALDRINVFIVDSTRVITAYKRDYGRIRMPLRYFEPADRLTESDITIVGSTIYGKDVESGRTWPWFEIVARIGIHEIEVELFDRINFLTLVELNIPPNQK
jgi:hypothetical protein